MVFGFSRNRKVVLNGVDRVTEDPEGRMCWRYGQNSGGFRVGTMRDESGKSEKYRKVIMYKKRSECH